VSARPPSRCAGFTGMWSVLALCRRARLPVAQALPGCGRCSPCVGAPAFPLRRLYRDVVGARPVSARLAFPLRRLPRVVVGAPCPRWARSPGAGSPGLSSVPLAPGGPTPLAQAPPGCRPYPSPPVGPLPWRRLHRMWSVPLAPGGPTLLAQAPPGCRPYPSPAVGPLSLRRLHRMWSVLALCRRARPSPRAGFTGMWSVPALCRRAWPSPCAGSPGLSSVPLAPGGPTPLAQASPGCGRHPLPPVGPLSWRRLHRDVVGPALCRRARLPVAQASPGCRPYPSPPVDPLPGIAPAEGRPTRGRAVGLSGAAGRHPGLRRGMGRGGGCGRPRSAGGTGMSGGRGGGAAGSPTARCGRVRGASRGIRGEHSLPCAPAGGNIAVAGPENPGATIPAGATS